MERGIIPSYLKGVDEMEQYCQECNQNMTINLQSHWIDKGVKEYFQKCDQCGTVYKSHLEDKAIRNLQNQQRKVVGLLRRHAITGPRRENLIRRHDEQKLQIYHRMKELEAKYWSE